MAYEFTFMEGGVLSGRLYVEKLTHQGAALMETSNWVLGDMVWTIVGLAVVLGLMALNGYVQRLARIEEKQRIELMGSDPLNLNRQRSAASQSRRPDDI
jgi:hypothetical protein